jgi:hypothetical protein
VWRTRTPFLVRHPWILDGLESIKTRTGSDATSRTETANQRGGSEWEPIKILFKNTAYEPNFTRAPPQASLAKFT